VAQIMKPHWPHAGLSSAGLEPLTQLRGVKDVSAFRVGEDQVVITRVRRLTVMLFQFGAQSLGEGHCSTRAARLRRAKLPAGKRSSNADEVRAPVNVLPSQSYCFAATQTGHRGREIEEPVGSP